MRIRPILLLGAAASLAAVATVLGIVVSPLSPPLGGGQAEAATITVRVGDVWFCDQNKPDSCPQGISNVTPVNIGDTVLWQWVGVLPHTTTHCAEGTFSPCSQVPREWASPSMTSGSFSHTFGPEDAGQSFLYICQVHPLSMRSVIEVQEPDADGDTVPDSQDNCPSIPNPGQEDADSDALGDVCDNCPQDANPGQEDADADSVGDVCDNCPQDANPGQEDADADTVGDVCDNCPAVANADQRDTDNDGEGDLCDPDIDGDGIPNDSDTDDDGDGYDDADEILKGSDPLDPSSTPEHADGIDNDGDTLIDEEPTGANWDIDGDTTIDSLDTDVDTDGDGIPNSADGTLNTGDTDDDGDGFSDARERAMTTDELDPCPGPNDALPSDADRDRDIDVGDVIALFNNKINTPAHYSARSDFDADSDNDIGDVIIGFFGKIFTKCYEFAFTNTTGGDVDRIDIMFSTNINQVFSALDDGLGSWDGRDLGGNPTIVIRRTTGNLADNGVLTVVVRGPTSPAVSVSSSGFSLETP